MGWPMNNGPMSYDVAYVGNEVVVEVAYMQCNGL